MPDKDFVSKALESAKSALASAKKFTGSTGDTDPSMFAAKPAPKAAPAPKPKPANDAESIAGGLKWRAEQAKGLGSFKKGGTVPKTGMYKLHEGEQVIPADIMDKATSALGGSKKPKRKLHMTIKPTDDDRFYVTHNHMGVEPMESSEHAPSNLKELLAHVEKHYTPESEESSKEE